jgi:ligand-binding SRPBCC domain-containing protein
MAIFPDILFCDNPHLSEVLGTPDMQIICLETRMNAPIELCFDLARSIEIHLRSTEKTREKVVGRAAIGLLGPNDEVTWEATHLGIRQRLTSRITVWNPPHHFRESMVRGAFRSFDHDHFFEHDQGITTMKDLLEYTSPCGVLGRLAETLFLNRYMERLLRTRADVIRLAAEAGDIPT